LAVVDRLESEYLALFEYLFVASPQLVASLGPPPGHGGIGGVGILRLQDERRHEFN